MVQKLQPLLLCGRAGTRLWPLSYKSYPKQFTRLTGEESLLQPSALGYLSPVLFEERNAQARPKQAA